RAGIVTTVEAGRLSVQRAAAAPESAAGLGAGPFLCGRASRAAAATGRRRPFDQRIENVRPLAVDIERDAAKRSFGNAGLEPGPGFAAVGRFPDPASWAAAVHAARRAAPLIARRIENLIVGGVHHKIVRAGVVVDFQRLFPGLAAISGFEHAALATSSPQTAGRRDEDDVVVARIDDDAVDVARRAEAQVR